MGWGRASWFAKRSVAFLFTLGALYGANTLSARRAELAMESSSARVALEAETGVTIVGHRSDVEESPQFDSLSAILRAERAKGILPFDTVRFVPESPLERYPLEQLLLQAHNVAGFAPPWSRTITLFASWDTDIIYHEIGHMLAYRAAREDTSFTRKWRSTTTDSSGSSRYLPLVQQAASYTSKLRWLLPTQVEGSRELLKEGFVSEYARTNRFEDQAELAGRINSGDLALVDSALKQGNQPLLGKIKLLDLHGVVPANILQYSFVRLFDQRYGYGEAFTYAPLMGRYVTKAKEFLALYPNSVFAPSVENRVDEIEGYLAKASEAGARERYAALEAESYRFLAAARGPQTDYSPLSARVPTNIPSSFVLFAGLR